MSQRLTRLSPGSGITVCWFYQNAHPYLPLHRMRQLHLRVPCNLSNPAKITKPYQSLRFYTRVAVAQNSAQNIDIRQPVPALSETAQDVEYTEDEKNEYSVLQAEHQYQLQSNADQLVGLLGRPLSTLRSERVDVRNRELLQVHLANVASEATSSSLDLNVSPEGVPVPPFRNITFPLLRHQLMACKNAKEIERVLTTAFKDPEGRHFTDTGSKPFKTANFLRYPAAISLLASRFNDGQQLRYPNTVLATTINNIHNTGTFVPLLMPLLALNYAAAGHVTDSLIRYFQILRVDVEGVKTESERVSMPRIQGDTPIYLPWVWLVEFLKNLRQGYNRGSIFTGERRPQVLGKLLRALRPHIDPQYQGTGDIFDCWPILENWVSLLSECELSDQIWPIWKSVWARTEKYEWTARSRGVEHCNKLAQYFIHMFLQAGDPQKAWQVYKLYSEHVDSREFNRPDDEKLARNDWATIRALVAHADTKPEFGSRQQFDWESRLLNFCTRELERLEFKLGIRWNRENSTHYVKPRGLEHRSYNKLEACDTAVDTLVMEEPDEPPKSRRIQGIPKWPACSMSEAELREFFENYNEKANRLNQRSSWKRLNSTFTIWRRERGLKPFSIDDSERWIDLDEEAFRWVLKRRRKIGTYMRQKSKLMTELTG